MSEWFTDRFAACQQWVFETLMQPLVYGLGLGGRIEDAFDATGWLLVGLIQLAVLIAVIGPLQRWRPVEAVTDRAGIRTDILYTVIHRLGLFRVAMFLVLQPVFDEWLGLLRAAGWGTLHLDELVPGVTDIAWVSIAIYIVVLDFVEYLIHRGQHRFNWWWGLHSLHHSQRQMTMWSDNRNHLLDDVLHDTIIVVVAQLIGVPPGQFIAIVALMQLSESLQHANLRLSFGAIGERLWVSPRFHRTHHRIGDYGAEGDGHEKLPKGEIHGSNYGVLLPWWDILFRTGNFTDRYEPTGIRDQVEPDAGGRVREYGRGFWSQQWLGLLRLVGRG
jgi:sterol desaturase/sphingolipid hydroxylase (fatty acid hydroxylase superfamily)